VRDNFVARTASANEEGKFVRIGRRFLSDGKPFVDEFSTGEEYFSPEILGLGRSIAIGEEDYLIKQLQKLFAPSDCASKTEMIEKLNAHETPLAVAFIPLEYMNDFYSLRIPGARMEFEPGRTYLNVGSNKMRIYWSHKYVKFTHFLFLAHDAIEWVVKSDPETEAWLRVDIKPSGSKQFEVNVETIVLCNLLNQTHGLAISLKERPIDVTHGERPELPRLDERIIDGYYFEMKELAPGIIRVAGFETATKPNLTSNPVDPSRIERLLQLFRHLSHLPQYEVEFEQPAQLKAQGTDVLVRGIRANISKKDMSNVTIDEIRRLIEENLA
jgi:hypothetical protein